MYLKLSVTKLVSALKLEGRALISFGTVLWYPFQRTELQATLSHERKQKKRTIPKVRETRISSAAHISYRIATVPALPRKGPLYLFKTQLIALQWLNINLLVSGGRTVVKWSGTGKVPTYSQGKWSEFSFLTRSEFKPLNRVITTIMDETPGENSTLYDKKEEPLQ